MLGLCDDEFEPRDVALLRLDHVIAGCNLLLDLFDVPIQGCVLLLILLLLIGLCGDSVILALDLLLEL